LNGFLVCGDTLGNDNEFLVDYAAMERLGFPKAGVDRARVEQFKAPQGLLPQSLFFCIMHDAVKGADGKWNYPGTLEERYQCPSKTGGLFCHGDGQVAVRKQADGTSAEIVCNPFGKAGCAAVDFCPYSGDKKPCKLNYKVRVCLMLRAGDGTFEPLDNTLGAQGVYLFQSTSEIASMDLFETFDLAADRVRGMLHWLTGTMTFQKKRRMANDGQKIVGTVFFQIHEESIQAREEQIREEENRRARNRLGEHQSEVRVLPAAAKALPAPATVTSPVVEEPEETFAEPPATGGEHAPTDTPEHLVEKLHAHILSIVESDGANYTDALNEFCFGSPDGMSLPEGKFLAIKTADWFLSAKQPAKRQRAIDMLLEICGRIDAVPADEPDDMFGDTEAAPCEQH
jgi:hypothetical protein